MVAYFLLVALQLMLHMLICVIKCLRLFAGIERIETNLVKCHGIVFVIIGSLSILITYFILSVQIIIEVPGNSRLLECLQVHQLIAWNSIIFLERHASIKRHECFDGLSLLLELRKLHSGVPSWLVNLSLIDWTFKILLLIYVCQLIRFICLIEFILGTCNRFFFIKSRSLVHSLVGLWGKQPNIC